MDMEVRGRKSPFQWQKPFPQDAPITSSQHMDSLQSTSRDMETPTSKLELQYNYKCPLAKLEATCYLWTVTRNTPVEI